jgi:hypothetical protein
MADPVDAVEFSNIGATTRDLATVQTRLRPTVTTICDQSSALMYHETPPRKGYGGEG